MIDMNMAATKTTPTATFWLIRDSTASSLGDASSGIRLQEPRGRGKFRGSPAQAAINRTEGMRFGTVYKQVIGSK